MDDALDVLEWRNDRASIAASKTGAVDQASHLDWFAKAIVSRDHDLFIATENGRKLGMIRFDKLHESWLVSINLAPAERRRGYGAKALQKAIAEVGTRRLLAEIKADNFASICIFERCGFRQVGAEEGFLRFARP